MRKILALLFCIAPLAVNAVEMRPVHYDTDATELQYNDNGTPVTIPYTGPAGPQGLQGDAGEGVPAGGGTGQVLTKSSGTDFDTQWSTVAGGGGSGIGVNIEDYGADGTDAVDDTDEIIAAIAATPNGGTLFIPAGEFLVSGTGTEIFLITKKMNIVGEGWGSVIKVATGTSTSRDVFRFRFFDAGVTLRDFAIKGQSAGVARHGIMIDTTATTYATYNWAIDHLFIFNLSGYSIYHKSDSSNPSGGWFYSTVRECNLASIRLDYTGDTIVLEDNVITGDDVQAIYASQISGAGGLQVIRNSLGNKGGAIEIASGVSPYIEGNTMETPYGLTYTQSNNAMIDITGAIANVWQPKIIGNQIQALATTGNPNPIRIAAATNAVVNTNRIAVPSAYSHAVITSSATDAQFGSQNQFVTNSVIGDASISNSGTRTIYPSNGPWVAYTPTVTAGTGALTSYTASGRYMIHGKTVYVQVKITVTNNGTGATNIQFTLPAAAKDSSVLAGREAAATGKALAGFVAANASSMSVTNYDYTYPASTGAVLVLSGFYERN